MLLPVIRIWQVRYMFFFLMKYTYVSFPIEENIIEKIKNVFDEAVLQYVCVASFANVPHIYSRSTPIVYMQIILKKRMQKKTAFLKNVAGITNRFEWYHY